MFGGRDKSRKGGSSASTSTSTSTSSSSRRQGTGTDPITHAGITNLGNSCYLASVVQGLGASRPLRDALAEYPGAEKALRRAKGQQEEEGTTANHPPGHENADDGGAGTEPEEEQEEQPAYNVPLGTPTAETSPALQLLNENPFPDSIPLSSALASTLVKLWSGKQSQISVKTLMRALNRKNEDWNEWDQMDAHELLRFLLDAVSMEELDLIKKLHPPPAPKPSKKKQKRGGGARTRGTNKLNETSASSSSSDADDSSDDLDSSEAESLLAEDPTYRLPSRPPPEPRFTPFIETIFGGKLASVIVCEECRGVNRIEEDFLDISLPIKGDDGAKVRRRDRLRKFLSSSSSNLNAAAPRPRLAPRAPTAILHVSETEGSEVDEAKGSRPSRQDSMASASSGAISNTSGPPLPDHTDGDEDEDEKAAKARRRSSLDPGILRTSSTRRNFLSPLGTGNGESKNGASVSRRSSIRHSEASGNESSSKRDGNRTEGSVSSVSRTKSKTKSSSSLLSKPSKEQQEYIQKLFAEVPSPSPLAGLRIAQPNSPSSPLADGGHHHHLSLHQDSSVTTGLYNCLVQFTNVEVLEGENAFQCRRCWKLLNPGLVAQVGRKRAAKLLEKRGQALHHNHNHHNHHQSIDRDIDGDGTATPVNGQGAAKLTLNTNRTRSASNTATLHSIDQQLLSTTGQNGSGVSRGPDISITAASPTLSTRTSETSVSRTEREASVPASASPPHPPVAQSIPEDDEAGMSGFSQLTVTQSSGSSHHHRRDVSDGLDSATEGEFSDAGAEADDEDQSAISGGTSNPSSSTHALDTGLVSASTSSVSFADQIPPSASASSSAGKSNSLSQAGKASAAMNHQPHLPKGMPTLPPRAQRYISRRAHKRYLISSLPPILVLHLKRFQQTSKSSLFGSFSNLKKLDDKVTFPIYLNMAPFMAPPPLNTKTESAMEKAMNEVGLEDASTGASSVSGLAHDDRHRSSSSVSADSSHHSGHRRWFRRASPSAETRAKCQYRLYAVIVHQGNMTSGHYVAFCYISQKKVEGRKVNPAPTPGDDESITKSDSEAPRRWVYCSDDEVRAASVEEVLNSQAYCLLYERVDPGSEARL